MDEYLATLQKSSKPFFDEEKRQGTIMDYKIFLERNQGESG